MQLKLDKPYIALNFEMYIVVCVKGIGYEFYCEELFVVKSKSKLSCTSAVYFNLGANIIKENSNF